MVIEPSVHFSKINTRAATGPQRGGACGRLVIAGDRRSLVPPVPTFRDQLGDHHQSFPRKVPPLTRLASNARTMSGILRKRAPSGGGPQPGSSACEIPRSSLGLFQLLDES